MAARNSLRAGLRVGVSTIRNGAEIIDTYSKQLMKCFTKKSTGKDCILNQKLRSLNLGECGNKLARCTRLAAHLHQHSIPLEDYTN